MSRRRNQRRPEQINLLRTTVRPEHSRKIYEQMLTWSAVVIAMILAVGLTLHFGLTILLDHAIFHNSRYALKTIEIEPHDHFSTFQIRQAAGLEPGENLWQINLALASQQLETLPYVSSAKIERHFPDKIVIHIHERVPVAKLVALSLQSNQPETFYLDHAGYVLKPRAGENLLLLPRIVGLPSAEFDSGMQVDQPALASALTILDALNASSLHDTIDIQIIDLTQPLFIRMVTTQQMNITFRLDCVSQQLLRLQQILAGIDNHAIRNIDLSIDNYTPLTFYN